MPSHKSVKVVSHGGQTRNESLLWAPRKYFACCRWTSDRWPNCRACRTVKSFPLRVSGPNWVKSKRNDRTMMPSIASSFNNCCISLIDCIERWLLEPTDWACWRLASLTEGPILFCDLIPNLQPDWLRCLCDDVLRKTSCLALNKCRMDPVDILDWWVRLL